MHNIPLGILSIFLSLSLYACSFLMHYAQIVGNEIARLANEDQTRTADSKWFHVLLMKFTDLINVSDIDGAKKESAAAHTKQQRQISSFVGALAWLS